MILCIFEGEKKEPKWFDKLRPLYLVNEIVEYSYVGGTFHSLYKQLKEHEWDLIGALKMFEKKNGGGILQNYKISDFSEVYLFFDYDPHDKKNDLTKLNEELGEMLAFFNEETENGKMFVSYPMLEALVYTKKLPDTQFYSYSIEVSKCGSFKSISSGFSYYGSTEFMDVASNWNELVKQNVAKANYICNGDNIMPNDKDSVSQQKILSCQIEKYLSCNEPCIAILSAFAMFVFYYLDIDLLQ